MEHLTREEHADLFNSSLKSETYKSLTGREQDCFLAGMKRAQRLSAESSVHMSNLHPEEFETASLGMGN